MPSGRPPKSPEHGEEQRNIILAAILEAQWYIDGLEVNSDFVAQWINENVMECNAGQARRDLDHYTDQGYFTCRMVDHRKHWSAKRAVAARGNWRVDERVYELIQKDRENFDAQFARIFG